MVALKEKQTVVCGTLGEIQATLCCEGRDQCGEAAMDHNPCCASRSSLAVAISCLPLSRLCWDVMSPSSPHLRQMGLPTPGYSVMYLPIPGVCGLTTKQVAEKTSLKWNEGPMEKKNQRIIK